ncbi:helix-turn-helix transcriptional regulator [Acidobacteria bacterium AB60]|nr:helix-turn-helix transcriptional regulator [Acidobacteria bacterium AB60]
MPIDVCVRIGRRIRYFRTERGISQAMLADRIGLTRTNLSRIENGKAEPGIRTLVQIARALGLKVAQLVEGTD